MQARLLGALSGQVGLQGVSVKNSESLNLKAHGCGEISREQARLRNSNNPRKPPEKSTFLSLAFYNAPSFWEPVDPVVADPVRQDSNKRNNIQMNKEIPY